MQILMIAALLLAADAGPMRCDNLVVAPGDNKLDVLSACGQPAWRETVSAPDDAPEEVWIYDWPEKGVQRLLHFKGIELARIEDGERLPASPGGGVMRCKNQVMHAGTTKLTVRNRCGEPDLVEPVTSDKERRGETWIYRRVATRLNCVSTAFGFP